MILGLFVAGSYLYVSTSYDFAMGDEAIYALMTRLLDEKSQLDLTAHAPLAFGQYLIGYGASSIFGYSLKLVHLCAYSVTFLSLVVFYVLLLQSGLPRAGAVLGSLCLFLNPIGLRFLDWYMTEPFFFLYLLLALNLYVLAFRSRRAGYLYLAAAASTAAVLTRQHAICVPLAALLLLLVRRERLRGLGAHILVTSFLPLASLAAISLLLLREVSSNYSRFLSNTMSLNDPVRLLAVLARDALYALHYCALCVLPMILVVPLAGITARKKLTAEFLPYPFVALAAASLIGAGTAFVYLHDQKLMPYLPSVFGIGSVPNFFGTTPWAKSVALTVLTSIGAAFLLATTAQEAWGRVRQVDSIRRPTTAADRALGRPFFALTALTYFLVAVGVSLVYDRYVWPLSIFVLALLLPKISQLRGFRGAATLCLALTYVAFMPSIKQGRLAEESLWNAGRSLVSRGVDPLRINAGYGFNFYHDFREIRDLYSNTRMRRPVNWHKFHPLADYFVSFRAGLEKNPELELYDPPPGAAGDRSAGPSPFIYKRKPGSDGFIWPQ